MSHMDYRADLFSRPLDKVMARLAVSQHEDQYFYRLPFTLEA